MLNDQRVAQMTNIKQIITEKNIFSMLLLSSLYYY